MPSITFRLSDDLAARVDATAGRSRTAKLTALIERGLAGRRSRPPRRAPESEGKTP